MAEFQWRPQVETIPRSIRYWMCNTGHKVPEPAVRLVHIGTLEIRLCKSCCHELAKSLGRAIA